MEKYDVLGIGHALVDAIYATTDEFISKQNLVKGQMVLCDGKRMEGLRENLPSEPKAIVAGGSCSNTIALLGRLGAKCAFLGKVADDMQGRRFGLSMLECNVDCRLKMEKAIAANSSLSPAAENATGQCLVLITADAQRSFATHLGISANLTPQEVEQSIGVQAKYLYLEGYLFGGAHGASLSQASLFEVAARAYKKQQHAENAKGKIALSLSDPFCVEQNQKDFRKFIEQHVDLLFANEAEGKALLQLDGELLSDRLRANLEKKFAEIGCATCLTFGADGALLLDENAKATFAPPHLAKTCIDTSGAGDAFAAGILFGLAKGWSLPEAGSLANRLGGEVVQHVGPRILGDVKNFLE